VKQEYFFEFKLRICSMHEQKPVDMEFEVSYTQ